MSDHEINPAETVCRFPKCVENDCTRVRCAGRPTHCDACCPEVAREFDRARTAVAQPETET